MKKIYPISAILIIAAILALSVSQRDRWQDDRKLNPAPVTPKSDFKEQNTVTGSDKNTKTAAQHTDASDKPDPNDPRVTHTKEGFNIYNPSFKRSQRLTENLNTDEAIDVIIDLLSSYRFVYKENPVALSNASVVHNLLGSNSKKVIFMDRQIQAIVDGKLVDQWRTPYFFHAKSGTEMEILSAGPDLQMWTQDDITSY